MELVSNTRCSECGRHCATLVRMSRGGPYCWDCCVGALRLMRPEVYAVTLQRCQFLGFCFGPPPEVSQAYRPPMMRDGQAAGQDRAIQNALIDRKSPTFFDDPADGK
jgi:hypothetical protein